MVLLCLLHKPFASKVPFMIIMVRCHRIYTCTANLGVRETTSDGRRLLEARNEATMHPRDAYGYVVPVT